MSRPEPRRIISDAPAGIDLNEIIKHANNDDRLKLLNDDTVPAADLDNTLHPIFLHSHCLRASKNTTQALRLASQFLSHSSVLEFFITLVHGDALIDTDSGTTYLSDPLANRPSKIKLIKMLDETRKALRCLAHCITFESIALEKRVYGSTLMRNGPPPCNLTCYSGFQRNTSVSIRISERFIKYYLDTETGYLTASRCDQFRHDFVFAITLVHEIIHAVGIMKRGCMDEPYIRQEYPESEWGFAWEHFMFGAILNPQETGHLGTAVILRKIWHNTETFNKHGGKEYSAVPVAYMAQWFRKSTWEVIAREGPTGIPPPTTRLKIVASLRRERRRPWVIKSDCKETRHDILQLRDYWKERHGRGSERRGKKVLSTIQWRFVGSKRLQKSKVPLHVRIPNRLSILSGGKLLRRNSECLLLDSDLKQQASLPNQVFPGNTSGKRKAEPEDLSVRPHKVIKPLPITVRESVG